MLFWHFRSFSSSCHYYQDCILSNLFLMQLSVSWKPKLKVPACMLSHVRLFVTPWTVAGQAPLSMGFSKQEDWSGLQVPPPGDLPDPGMEPAAPASSALAGGFLTTPLPAKPKLKVVDENFLMRNPNRTALSWKSQSSTWSFIFFPHVLITPQIHGMFLEARDTMWSFHAISDNVRI